MKKFMIIPAILLVFGLLVSGCDTGGDWGVLKGGGGGGGGGAGITILDTVVLFDGSVWNTSLLGTVTKGILTNPDADDPGNNDKLELYTFTNTLEIPAGQRGMFILEVEQDTSSDPDFADHDLWFMQIAVVSGSDDVYVNPTGDEDLGDFEESFIISKKVTSIDAIAWIAMGCGGSHFWSGCWDAFLLKSVTFVTFLPPPGEGISWEDGLDLLEEWEQDKKAAKE